MKESNKNNPFTTPEGYFENFTDRLMGELSQESPDLPIEEGFIIPDNYFDEVYENVQRQVAPKEIKVRQLHPYRKYYFAAAAAAAVILLIFGLNRNASEEFTFESLAASEIENYFETNEYDLSAYELAEVIPLDELNIDDMLTNRFEEENVIDYLDDNIEDFEELNLEDYE